MTSNLAIKKTPNLTEISLSSATKISRPVSARSIALLVLALDLLGISGSFILTYFLKFGTVSLVPGSQYFPLLMILVTILCLYVFDLYKLDVQVSGLRAPGRTVVAIIIAAVFTVVMGYALHPLFNNRVIFRGVIVPTFGLFALWATSWRFLLGVWLKGRLDQMRWLVIGDRECFDYFYRDFKKYSGDQLLVFVSDSVGDFSAYDLFKDENISFITGWENTGELLNREWSGIVVATRANLPHDLVEKLMRARLKGSRVYSLTAFYEDFWLKLPVIHLKSGWFAFSDGFYLQHNRIGLRTKRIADIFLSLLLLAPTLPLMAMIAVLIKLESRGPVLYKQIRSGQRGKPFSLYKFRSMRQDAEKDGAKWAIKDDPRITRLGKLLRKTRIDELPQLLNVFRGEMSFIGPRPERPVFNEKLEKQIPFYDMRHIVKPGITGWAQVMYAYGASIEDAREKLQYDLYYIKNYSFLLDVAIIFKTIRVILFGKGR